MSLRPAANCHYHRDVHATLSAPRQIAQLFALIIILTSTAFAQTSDAAQGAFNPAVYRVGERLTYNVNYAHFVGAAHIELFVAARGKFFDRNGIQLKAHVETAGVVNVALLSINNDYTTYVYPETGQPYRSQQVVREAGRTIEGSRDYNQPAGTDAIPPKMRMGEFAGIYDLLSALYRVRAMPLAMGSTYYTNVRYENDEYQAEIRVVGKELVKTSVGSFDAIVTRVNVRGPEDFKFWVYFSDDEWHVPVSVCAKYGGGEIEAELAGSALETPVAAAPRERTKVEPAPKISVTAQTPGNLPGSSPNPAADPAAASGPTDFPFKVGERLNYQIYLAKGTQPVGTLTLSVNNRGRYFNRDGLQFSASAQVSGGPMIVKDQITSYVDPVTLLPYRTELNFAEGKYHSARSYNLDQDRGAATNDTSRDRLDIPVGTYDLVSAIYALRTFDLSILKQNAISVMAVNRPRTLFVKAVRRDTIQLNGQNIAAVVLELSTDEPQSDLLQVRMWVGDDSRRLPLRITANTGIGAIRADLAVVPASR